MLRYDYVIERDEGDITQVYKPHLIPKELADIVYIKGPNSSGKSTLLNFIALGFYGLKLREQELNSALREKLENLINSSHQKIKFNIEIENKSLSTKIISKKPDLNSKNFNVKLIQNRKEKPLTQEMFQKEFKLIYDIPNNPLKRLQELLIEIKSAQIFKGNLVTQLKEKLKDSIDEVKSAKDPVMLENNLQTVK